MAPLDFLTVKMNRTINKCQEFNFPVLFLAPKLEWAEASTLLTKIRQITKGHLGFSNFVENYNHSEWLDQVKQLAQLTNATI